MFIPTKYGRCLGKACMFKMERWALFGSGLKLESGEKMELNKFDRICCLSYEQFQGVCLRKIIAEAVNYFNTIKT